MSFYNYTSASGGQFNGPWEPSTPDRLSRHLVYPYPGFPDGATIDILDNGQEGQGVYLLVEIDKDPVAAFGDRYYRPADPAFTLSFNGTEYQPSATVVKTYNWESWTLEQIYRSKQADIGAQDTAVMFNAVDTALSQNWWLIVTQRARFELYTLNDGGLRRRQDGDSWPTGQNQPWAPIYNAATGEARRQRIATQGAWETVMLEELPQHDNETGNATDASNNALDAAYNGGAGNRADVVAHDPADPAWGYPPTVDIGDAAARLYGNFRT